MIKHVLAVFISTRNFLSQIRKIITAKFHANRQAKRVVVAVFGGTVTLIGIALIVLPGPAFIVIPIGLSILATEFLWAKRYLHNGRQLMTRLRTKFRSKK